MMKNVLKLLLLVVLTALVSDGYCGVEEIKELSYSSNNIAYGNDAVAIHSSISDLSKLFDGVPFKHRIYGNLEAEIVRVVDGDTYYVNIPGVHPVLGYEIAVRVYGIDTREMDDGGSKSKKFMTTLLPIGTHVILKDIRRGKYFRIVSDVVMKNGRSVSDILLDKDLAYPYYGGTKRPKGWKPTEYQKEGGK